MDAINKVADLGFNSVQRRNEAKLVEMMLSENIYCLYGLCLVIYPNDMQGTAPQT